MQAQRFRLCGLWSGRDPGVGRWICGGEGRRRREVQGVHGEGPTRPLQYHVHDGRRNGGPRGGGPTSRRLRRGEEEGFSVGKSNSSCKTYSRSNKNGNGFSLLLSPSLLSLFLCLCFLCVSRSPSPRPLPCVPCGAIEGQTTRFTNETFPSHNDSAVSNCTLLHLCAETQRTAQNKLTKLRT